MVSAVVLILIIGMAIVQPMVSKYTYDQQDSGLLSIRGRQQSIGSAQMSWAEIFLYVAGKAQESAL